MLFFCFFRVQSMQQLVCYCCRFVFVNLNVLKLLIKCHCKCNCSVFLDALLLLRSVPKPSWPLEVVIVYLLTFFSVYWKKKIVCTICPLSFFFTEWQKFNWNESWGHIYAEKLWNGHKIKPVKLLSIFLQVCVFAVHTHYYQAYGYCKLKCVWPFPFSWLVHHSQNTVSQAGGLLSLRVWYTVIRGGLGPLAVSVYGL